MLVLSRKKGECIVINQHSLTIEIMVVEVRGGRVRLSINAPKEIPISRRDEKEKESEH